MKKGGKPERTKRKAKRAAKRAARRRDVEATDARKAASEDKARGVVRRGLKLVRSPKVKVEGS